MPYPSETEVLRLKQVYESRLMAVENVAGVGVGASSDGNPCIKVYVSELSSAVKDQIPAELGGVRVEIEITGSIGIFTRH